MATSKNLTTKINKCYDFGMLYALKEDFNKVGLTIHPTVSQKMVLCKIVEGKAYAEALAQDYIFVGHQLDPGYPIPERLLKCVVEFVEEKSAGPAEILEVQGADTTALYGDSLSIKSEDMENLGQQMCIEEKLTSDDLLHAIGEWLNEDKEL